MGAQGIFRFGQITAKQFSERVWGENGYTQRVLGYHRNHYPGRKTGNLVVDRSLHKIMFFGPPVLGPKNDPRLLGPRCGAWAPKIGSGVKCIKVAGRKTMQKTLVVAPNGAICCKLWPKTILGVGAPNFEGPSVPKKSHVTLKAELWEAPYELKTRFCAPGGVSF